MESDCGCHGIEPFAALYHIDKARENDLLGISTLNSERLFNYLVLISHPVTVISPHFTFIFFTALIINQEFLIYLCIYLLFTPVSPPPLTSLLFTIAYLIFRIMTGIWWPLSGYLCQINSYVQIYLSLSWIGKLTAQAVCKNRAG